MALPVIDFNTGRIVETDPFLTTEAADFSMPQSGLGQIGQGIGDIFGSITGAGQSLLSSPNALMGLAGGLLTKESYDRLSDIGEQAKQEAMGLAERGQRESQFRPFTVTATTGSQLGSRVTPQGAIETTMDLSPQEQMLQQQLLSGAGGLFGQATQPMQAREQEVFERIRAAQRPEEQRQRLALEERLAAQGRLGTSSAAYGGATPELLAQQTGIQEARNMAMLNAMQQAQAEQAQQAALGQTLLGSGYLPQQALLEAARPGIMQQELAQQAQQFGTGLFGETALSGIEAQLLQEQARANLLGGVGGNLITGLINQQRAASAAPSSGGSSLGGLFSSVVGGLGNIGSGIERLLGTGG